MRRASATGSRASTRQRRWPSCWRSAKSGSGVIANVDHAIQQFVSRAVVTDGRAIDVFMAAELLATLLKGESATRASRSVVQGRQYSEMLKKTLNACHNRAINTQGIIG